MRQENIQKVVDAIKLKPMTIPALSVELGISQPTVKLILSDLLSRKMCFILDYEIREKSHARVAVYIFGEGTDAPRPACLTKAESNRRYKERARGAAETKRYARIRKELDRPAFRHPFDVWLFGAYEGTRAPSTIPRRTFRQDMTVTSEDEVGRLRRNRPADGM